MNRCLIFRGSLEAPAHLNATMDAHGLHLLQLCSWIELNSFLSSTTRVKVNFSFHTVKLKTKLPNGKKRLNNIIKDNTNIWCKYKSMNTTQVSSSHCLYCLYMYYLYCLSSVFESWFYLLVLFYFFFLLLLLFVLFNFIYNNLVFLFIYCIQIFLWLLSETSLRK